MIVTLKILVRLTEQRKNLLDERARLLQVLKEVNLSHKDCPCHAHSRVRNIINKEYKNLLKVTSDETQRQLLLTGTNN